MAVIDEAKRKPRRTKGTPTYQFRNKVAIGILAAGTAIFALFAQTTAFKNFNEYLKETLFTQTEEEIDRRHMFSFLKQNKADEIAKILEERDKLMDER